MNNAEHIIALINDARLRHKITDGEALPLIMRLAPMLNSPDYDDNSPEIQQLHEEVRDLCAIPPRYFVAVPMDNDKYVMADTRSFKNKTDALRYAGALGEREAIVLVEMKELPLCSQ